MQDKTEIINRIWSESRQKLKSFVARRVKNEADVEDILQDVFYKVHQNLNTLKETDKIYAWVYQIARNAIFDHYRLNDKDFLTAEETAEIAARESFDAEAEEEVLSWLQPMIEDLPEKYSRALLLADIQGITQKELAERLEISLSGAKSRVQRAREKLKASLLSCCHLEFDRQGRVIEYRQKQKECRYCRVNITRR